MRSGCLSSCQWHDGVQKLCLGMDEGPTESLWVRIKKRAGTGDITVWVCYRLPDQQDQEDEAIYRQRRAASHWEALVLMGDSKHPDICCRNSTAGHRQSRRPPAYTDDNCLLQVREGPTSRVAVLNFVLTNKKGLKRKVKLKGFWAEVTMKWCSSRSLKQWGGQEVSSLPWTSGVMHPYKKEAWQNFQEACVYEQVAPGKTQTQNRKPTENRNRGNMGNRESWRKYWLENLQPWQN